MMPFLNLDSRNFHKIAFTIFLFCFLKASFFNIREKTATEKIIFYCNEFSCRNESGSNFATVNAGQIIQFEIDSPYPYNSLLLSLGTLHAELVSIRTQSGSYNEKEERNIRLYLGNYIKIARIQKQIITIQTYETATIRPKVETEQVAIGISIPTILMTIALVTAIITISAMAIISSKSTINKHYAYFCFSMSMLQLSITGIGMSFIWPMKLDRLIFSTFCAVAVNLSFEVMLDFFPRLKQKHNFLIISNTVKLFFLFFVISAEFLIEMYLPLFFISGLSFGIASIWGILDVRKNLATPQITYAVGKSLLMLFGSLFIIFSITKTIEPSNNFYFLSLGMLADSICMFFALAAMQRAKEAEADNIILINLEQAQYLSNISKVSFDTFISTDPEFKVTKLQGNEDFFCNTLVHSPLLDFVFANDRMENRDSFLKTLAAGFCREFPIEIVKNGATQYFALNGTLTENNSWTFSVADRTKQVNTENMLRQSVKLAGLGSISAGIAHEINNPLSAMRLQSEIVLAKLEPFPEARAVAEPRLRRLLALADRISEIIDSVRSLYRNDSIVTADINPRVALAESIEAMQTLATACGATFEVSRVENSKWIIGNKNLLIQLISNLIKNSLDAMGTVPDRPKHIHFYFTSMEDYVALHMTDTGPGIAKENISKVFDPFYTTKKSEAGSGLGLSLCLSIANKHKGHLQCVPHEGGAHFVLTLPMAADQPVDVTTVV